MDGRYSASQTPENGTSPGGHWIRSFDLHAVAITRPSGDQAGHDQNFATRLALRIREIECYASAISHSR